ncbi:MAG: hypothetical protein ABJI69_00875 [Balneola sp.]
MEVLYIGEHVRFDSKIEELLTLQNYNGEFQIKQISEEVKLLTKSKINNDVNFDAVDLIVLDMSLEWHIDEFRLLAELRKGGALVPILLAVDKFKNAMKNELNWNIVNTPAHYLWEYTEQVLNKPLEVNFKLSEEAVDDILYSVFDKKGALENFLHDLKNEIGSGKNIEKVNVLNTIKDFYESQTPPMNPPESKIENFIERIAEDPQPHHIDSLADVIKSDFEEQSDDMSSQVTPWKVLFVDDEAHTRDAYKKVFQNVANIQCETASSGAEAFTILEQNLDDNAKPITVIITDYRFYEDDGMIWQKQQGYDIINTVYERHKSSPLGYFLLTSKRNIIMQLARYNGHPHVQSYEKGNLAKPLEQQERVKVFIDAIRNEGNRVYSSVLGGPKSASWLKGYTKADKKAPLKQYYFKYIQDRNFYEQTEASINQTVLELIQKVENPDVFRKSRIESLNELRTIFRFMSYRMGDHGISLQANISEPSFSEKGIEQFAWGVLFPRRTLLAIYLTYYRSAIIKKELPKSFDHIDDIVTCMIDFQNKDYVSAGSIKQVLNNRLCLGKNLERRVRNELLREEQQYFESKGLLE